MAKTSSKMASKPNTTFLYLIDALQSKTMDLVYSKNDGSILTVKATRDLTKLNKANKEALSKDFKNKNLLKFYNVATKSVDYLDVTNLISYDGCVINQTKSNQVDVKNVAKPVAVQPVKKQTITIKTTPKPDFVVPKQVLTTNEINELKQFEEGLKMSIQKFLQYNKNNNSGVSIKQARRV